MKTFSSLIIGFCFLIFCHKSFGQQVLMQGWYWDYPKTATGKSWADTLRLKAASLKEAGITHIWFPPHTIASFGNNSNGYDPKDLFIGNQTSGLGTRAALNAMLSEFSAQGIAPVADMVYNHRDGGLAETNPAVKAYITTHYTAVKEPFPSDRFRCVLPLGGTSNNGAGDYYIKISSKTGDSRFNGYGYKLYMQTNTTGFAGLPAQSEAEPNGGGDCGQGFNTTQLGRDMIAVVENVSLQCGTDEFKLTISNSDFNAAGDTLYIYLTNTGGYSDHRIYGLQSIARNADIVNELLYETYTNFNNVSSGRGQMNFESFKPNTSNTATTFLSGDWDGMFFFYDYDQFQPATKDTLINWTKWNWTDLGVRGLRIDAVKHFAPAFVGDLLDSMNVAGMNPSMVVGEWYSTNTADLSGWINNVKAAMEPATQAAIQPKIFDFTLRENLRQACDEAAFDTRNVFSGSLRDAGGLSGFNVVTFANNHDFRDASGFASLIKNNPDLAYAYILTNNQLGVPAIFYPDYYGYPAPLGGLYGYHPLNQIPLQPRLDRLMKVLQRYINGSPSVDYLNRFSTPYTSNFLEGSSGKSLIYQMQGFAGNGNKDVIVAINWGTTTLKVDHQINNRGGSIGVGTRFTDILAQSAFPYAQVNSSGQVYIELPPKSYSVWVQGTETVLPLQLLHFTAKAKENKVETSWIVTDNQEAAFFELQRAADGVNFTSIATIPARLLSGEVPYIFTDVRPIKNMSVLYRLKVIKKNRQEIFSNLQMVRINDGYSIKLIQNPVPHTLVLSVAAANRQTFSITIIDGKGMRVANRTELVWAGETIIQIPVTQLSAGVYQLIVQANGDRQTISFIKR